MFTVIVPLHFFAYDRSLDPEQKECLIEVIEKLVKDKTTVSDFFKQSNLHPPLPSPRAAPPLLPLPFLPSPAPLPCPLPLPLPL